MAIAASRAPDRVVNVSGSPVDGWKYKDVLQDTVDYLAWGQTDCGYGKGGWDYYPANNKCGRSDNSNTGWATFGLGFAESPTYGFSATIPDFVKTELSDHWINYIQCNPGDPRYTADYDGGSGYSSPCSWVNILKTGHLLYEMAFVGDNATTPRVINATNYLVRHWNDTNTDPGWRGNPASPWYWYRIANYHATFNVMKGLCALDIHEIDGIDWQADFEQVIVAQQVTNVTNVTNITGYWSGCQWGDDILCTEWALLTLEKVFPRIAIPANITIKPETLNLASKGEFTAFITLPEPYNITDINISTVVCEGAPAVNGMVADDNKYIAKFDREDLIGVEPGPEVELTVTGKLFDGTAFEGSDTIRVIDKGKGK